MENNFSVYAHINKTNGKIYIGLTSKPVEERWKNGKGYKGCYFNNAIKKYGWNNFDHEIVASNLSKKEAQKFEILLIERFDTMNKTKGYNITKGGDGTFGFKMSEEQRRKISFANSKENHNLWGKHHTEESKEKMRGERESITGNKHPLYNQKRTEEVKIKISETKKKNGKTKGANNPKARKIICLTTNEIFECIRDASKKYSIPESNIAQSLIRKQRYSGEHPITKEKMVWMYYEDYITKSELQIKDILNFDEFKKVICLTTGEIFDSTLEASDKYKIEKSSIGKCCRNKIKSAGKHPITGEKMVWSYISKS